MYLRTHAFAVGKGDLNTAVESLFQSSDPFVTRTRILCQQIGWHYEDLDPHCDKERPDKSNERQQPGWDGIGDRITSLTLRRSCWLFMRETKDHANSFAVHLEPGDIYTLAGESRWSWQHAILLDELPVGPLRTCAPSHTHAAKTHTYTPLPAAPLAGCASASYTVHHVCCDVIPAVRLAPALRPPRTPPTGHPGGLPGQLSLAAHRRVSRVVDDSVRHGTFRVPPGTRVRARTHRPRPSFGF